jgi:AmmeMemoRadiSam system protein A
MIPDLEFLSTARPPHRKEPLSQDERIILLQLARRALVDGVNKKPLFKITLKDYSQHLRDIGASFVTLTIQNNLRGCIGALEAYQSLVEDVCEHAVSAALNDYRFPPVKPDELALIKIEISSLTPAEQVEYNSPEELLRIIRPGIDGVIIKDGLHRATYLPQVWQMIPDPGLFFSSLCQKMGVPSNFWQKKSLQVYRYQVEEFHEE